MIHSQEIHRINNVAARVVLTDGGAEFYHPDCLPEAHKDRPIDENQVSIDHEYCGGDGRFTRYDDVCEHCHHELGESGGVQPGDEDE
jgi:hypothetical protein